MGVEQLRVFDAHFHIIDYRFPLTRNEGYLPPPFTVEDYLKKVSGYNFVGGAVISGSFQGFDTTYLVEALSRLGRGYVGVAQLPSNIGHREVMTLHHAGVRAVRFNLRRRGKGVLEYMERLSNRLFELVGWHSELYIDSRELGELEKILSRLPLLCVDHLGLSKEGFKTLLKLVEKGAYVKATGFGRLDFQASEAIAEVVRVNSNALIFGTDLPSTRAPVPYSHRDLELVIETLKDDRLIEKVLYSNAVSLYKPEE